MQIGPYQLTRCLGKGGMGEVWLGKRMALGGAARTVAVKLLHTPDATAGTGGPSSQSPAGESFIKEAKLAMLLRHSTIVQVNDVGESQGVCFMEMEWVEGLDLARLNERLAESGKKMPLVVAAYVVGEILKALAYAHTLDVDGKRETIVHRDVTPQNVLISKSGEVKLTDFGIAFMTSDKTSSDLIKGKSRYMSPEHVRQVREPCIDIFGAGAMFHEMLDGRKFRYTAETDLDLFSMAFSGAVPPLSIELPAELEEVRSGLLASDLDQRFPSARAALGALRRWPGYRDASEELEELVREVGMVEAPVGATEFLTAILDFNQATGGTNQAVAPTEVFVNDVERSKTATGTVPRARNRNWVAVILLVLIGLGFAGFAVAALMNPGEPVELAEAVEPNPGLEPAPVPTPKVEPEPVPPTPKIEPEPVEPAPVEPVPPTPVVEPAPVEPTPVEPKVEPIGTTSAPVAKKTNVTLKASGYPWVKIRIGSKEHVLDRKSSPSKVVALKPGKHSVAFQIDEEEPWQERGKITVPAQADAVLDLRKPGTFVIE